MAKVTTTSRQDDIPRPVERFLEAAKLACDSSKRKLPKDPHESPAFFVPLYMYRPQVFAVYDHYVRIWRAPAIDITRHDFRRCVGLLEFTPLKDDDGLTLGLEWFYSAHQIEPWHDFQYILYSHFPGCQPCRDLVDVYHSCSLEIRWAIICLQGREGLQQYRLQHKTGVRDAETGERIG